MNNSNTDNYFFSASTISIKENEIENKTVDILTICPEVYY